jgi:hypothetical protein
MAARKSTFEIASQWALSVGELGQLLGLSANETRRRLVNDQCEKVLVGDVPADGKAWVRFQGALIPGRRDANGDLRFIAADVRAALDTARLHR